MIERTTRCCIAVALVTLGAALFAQSRDTAPPSLQPLWSLPLGGAISAPPALVDDRAYIPLDGRRLDAIDLVRGVRLWSAALGALTRPAAGEGLVFAETSGAIVALRASDGATAWRRPLPEMLGAAVAYDNGWLITQSRAGSVTAHRALDGESLWAIDAGSPPNAPAALAADRVYLSLADGRVAALQVETGRTLWSRSLNGPPGEILALDDRLYVGSGGNGQRYFYAIDPQTGRIEWRWRIGGVPVGRPVIHERNVYFAAYDNVLRAIDRGNGAMRWHAILSLRPSAAPVIAGDLVIVAGMGPTLPAFNRTSGDPAGTARLPGDITAGPHVVDHPWSPIVLTITRDIALGDALRALGLPIEPAIVPVAPLPNTRRVQRPPATSPALRRPEPAPREAPGATPGASSGSR